MKTGRWKLPLCRWNQVVEKSPEMFIGYLGKGIVLLQIGDFAAATAIFEQVVVQFPDKHQSWLQLAQVANKRGQPELALIRLNEAIDKFPDVIQIGVHKANLLTV